STIRSPQESWGCRRRVTIYSNRKNARGRTGTCSAPSRALSAPPCERRPPTNLNSIPKDSQWLEEARRTEGPSSLFRSVATANQPFLGWLQVPSALHGLQHCDLVRILQVGPHGNPDANPRHAHTQGFQQFRKIDRSSFTLGRGICRDNDLFDRAAL